MTATQVEPAADESPLLPANILAPAVVAQRLGRVGSLADYPRGVISDGARREKAARRARRDFSEFFRQMFEDADPGKLEFWWHHQAMCDHLQAGVEDWDRAGREPDFVQRFQDLVVNIGPITLKSSIFMVAALAWIWLAWPGFKALFTSGSPTNVDRDSIACGELVTSAWYRETFRIPWTIHPRMNRVAMWGTTAGGVRISKGLASSWTGIHVDGIFGDDPDDAAGVHSAATRRDTELSVKALGNRLNDLKRPLRLWIQQNLTSEDTTSKLVRAGVPRLSIPLEYRASKRIPWPIAPRDGGDGDPRTVDGEILQPSRFTPAVITAERRRLGPRGFAGQYNCDPDSYENGIFKSEYWRFARIEGQAARERPAGMNADAPYIVGFRPDGTFDLDWLTISVDATFGSMSATASRVGLLLIGGKGMRRVVFKDKSRKRGFDASLTAIKDMAASVYERWAKRRTLTILIEAKANGAAIIEKLTSAVGAGELKMPDGRSFVAKVEAINPEGGKAARANAMEPEVAAGMWHVLEGEDWLLKGEDEDDAGFFAEVFPFPNGSKNDRVDSMSQVHAHYNEPSPSDRLRRLSRM